MLAAPTDDVSIIQTYWRDAAAIDPGSLGQGSDVAVGSNPQVQQLGNECAQAIAAMQDLVDASGSNPYTRQTVFAGNAIFESALSQTGVLATLGITATEASAGTTDFLVALSSSLTGISGSAPPRQVMLDGIYKAGVGGLFTPKDPTGITSWVHDLAAAESGIATALTTDPNAAVRASCLKIVADLALPVVWVKRTAATFGATPQRGAIETAVLQLQQSLATSPTLWWDQDSALWLPETFHG